MANDSWRTDVVRSELNTGSVLSDYQTGRNRGSVGFGGFVDNALAAGQGQHEVTTTGWESSWLNNDIELSDFLNPLGMRPTSTTTIEGYDIVGIAGGQVENMREAIRAYVKDVQTTLDQALGANAEEVKKAFRGTQVVTEVNNYVEKVKAYVTNVVSGLLVFSDKLADVGNAWRQATENMAGEVKATTGAFSEGQTYVDDMAYRAE